MPRRLALSLLPLCACAKAPVEAQSATPIEVEPALAETDPATAAQLCNDGTRGWAIYDEGAQEVAITRGSCLGLEESEFHFVTQLVADDVAQYELHMWVDEGGRPTRAQLRDGWVTTHFRWAGDSLLRSRHGDTQALQTQSQLDAPVWVLPSHAVYIRELMLRLGVGAIHVRTGSRI